MTTNPSSQAVKLLAYLYLDNYILIDNVVDILVKTLLLNDFSDLMRRSKITVTSIGAILVLADSDEIKEHNRLSWIPSSLRITLDALYLLVHYKDIQVFGLSVSVYDGNFLSHFHMSSTSRFSFTTFIIK
jgi:hypothetical protein